MPKRRKMTPEVSRKLRTITGVRGRSPSKGDKPSGNLTRTTYSKNKTSVVTPFVKGYETHPQTKKRLKK